jgi:hypothetical protein
MRTSYEVQQILTEKNAAHLNAVETRRRLEKETAEIRQVILDLDQEIRSLDYEYGRALDVEQARQMPVAVFSTLPGNDSYWKDSLFVEGRVVRATPSYFDVKLIYSDHRTNVRMYSRHGDYDRLAEQERMGVLDVDATEASCRAAGMKISARSKRKVKAPRGA